jgi:DNA-binding CsgD family transcriptional regulator
LLNRASPSVLTPRQKRVLEHLRKGLTNREIGDELGISEDGVKAHLSRLFLRFGVSNRVELLAAVEMDPVGDRASALDAELGSLRAIAGRANATTGAMNPTRNGNGLEATLSAVRQALASVDAALGIVSDLPPETTGPVVAAVRRRLAAAFDALENAQSEAAHTT